LKQAPTSINETEVELDAGDVTESLLGKDADEETRMSDRIAEKAVSTEGTEKRIADEQIRTISA